MESTADLVTASVNDIRAKQPKTFREMNSSERLAYIREVTTVEPLIAAYVAASILCAPAMYYLEFEKACRVNLALNDTVCDAILSDEHTIYTAENDQIQVLISNMHSWQQPLQSVMPLILVLFLGSYSDRHKWRKPFLLIPIIGEFFAVTGVILCVVFMKSWPLEAQGVAQTVVPSFFGGQTMIVMAVFAYIADVSTLEMRTLRVGIVQIVLNITVPAVQSFSGVLFTSVGYYGILFSAAGLYVFALVYGVFWIREPATPIKSNLKELCSDVFNPQLAIDTFKIMLKKSPGNDRIGIAIVLITLFVYSGVVVGETSLFYLYTQGKFQWLPDQFAYFGTVNTLIHLAGTAIAVPLFTKYLHLSDLTILQLTFLDKIICNLFFGFAETTPMLYVAACVSIITGVTAVAIRSLATKIVSEGDLGKAQSLFGICEAVAPAVAVPIYNRGIYVSTLNTFPAAFFFFGIALYVICCIIILLMYVKQRRDRSSVQGKTEIKNNVIDEKSVQLEDVQTTHM